jgi:DHA3 family macrolide efflux protein-like MFS transporter
MDRQPMPGGRQPDLPTGSRAEPAHGPTTDGPHVSPRAVAAGEPGPAGGPTVRVDEGGPAREVVLGDPRWIGSTVQFLAGQTVSLFGSSLVQYAILWHLTLATGSGVVLTAATVLGFLPQAVVSIFGGVWADRHNRRVLIIGADAFIAITTLVLALAFLRGDGQLWMILLAMALRSAAAGVQGPAVGAVLPQIVPTEHLMRVNGLNASIGSAMMLLSPAVAAALYAGLGLTAVLFVDVATAVIGIVLLALLAIPTLPRTGDPLGYTDDLRAGLRYAREHSAVRWILVSFAVVFLLVVPPSYLTPLMIVRTFGDEVWMLTANEVAFSVGMIIGGAALAAWGTRRDRMSLLTGATVAMGVLSLLLGLSSVLWVFLALMLLVGWSSRPSRPRRPRCCRRRWSRRCRGASSGCSASSWHWPCPSAWRSSARWPTSSAWRRC